ncbi:DnaJ C-terminal domain-containing protein [Bifidobacterium asteroides]|uniref:DnaJ C-terminal domain-containing protein n=1 Tax=Bifidobacterium asteroides TaxID=1684 RepID=UPI00031445A1|nr:DnaJ C-terminal domain-containing protein [Bifidobacterium asteroides]
MAGKGRPGRDGGANGDLYLQISVQPSQRFAMKDRDLVMTLPVTVAEAALGAKVQARDIDDQVVTFRIPAGSSSGDEIRIAGKGVQDRRGKGDLVGRLEIRMPGRLGMAQKKAMRDFAKSSGDFDERIAGERMKI